MKKQFGEYYLGLDIGTGSVGWAVSDLSYRQLKLNGKALWGVRLFEPGKPHRKDARPVALEEGSSAENNESAFCRNYLFRK